MKQLKKASILLSTISLLLTGCVASQNNQNREKTKIDLAEYLPSKSMIKKYTYKSKAPWLKGESSGIDKIKITVGKNKISFYHEQEPISYTTVTKIGKKFITEDLEASPTEKHRYVSVGDITTFSTSKTLKKSCVLQNILKEFSHGGHHYSGEIVHEKCTTKQKMGSEKIRIDTYATYSKKGIGVIAIINNRCYGKNRYAYDKNGCHSDGYHHTYYMENK